MKKLLIITMLTILCLNGCANMTKEQQTASGVGLGALLGAGIGAALGGKSGAALGAGLGAAVGGAVAYALASDPYTQSVNQQTVTWQEQTGVKPEIVKVSQVVENGQIVQRIDSQKLIISNEKMLSGNHLSSIVKNQLITAKKESLKVGGNVHVICPTNTTQTIIKEISKTGVTYSKDETLDKGYVVVFSRDRDIQPKQELPKIGEPAGFTS